MRVKIMLSGEDLVFIQEDVTQDQFDLLMRMQAAFRIAKKEQDAEYAPSFTVNLLN
jgi:hypothetical protein